MKPLFSDIALIGCGLIGSSICHAIKRYHAQQETTQKITQKITPPHIHIIDNNPAHLQKAQELSLGDSYYADAKQGVQHADLIILATPVGTYQAIGKEICAHIKQGAIISDVGSTKQSIIAQLAPILPQHCTLIPAHPIAGTENSGPEAGFANLFEHRYVIMTPSDDCPAEQVKKLTEFWQNFGAMIEMMSPERHDKVLAITSHLPHLMAYTIVGTARNLENKFNHENKDGGDDGKDTPSLNNDVIRFSAGGFRDFTRIAASDPIMWRDVFLHNREAVLELLTIFRNDLDTLTDAITQKDGQKLEEWFDNTRIIRRQIIEEKQAGHFIATEDDTI